MEISPGIEIVDLCLYFRKEKTLVIPDMHLGYEEAMNKQGVLIPRVQFKDTVERLEKVFKEIKTDKVIIIGDIKHEFGTISSTEWKNILGIFDFLLQYAKEVIILRGNHDPILSPITRKRNLEVLDFTTLGDTFLCHGDVILENEAFTKAKRVVIGHEHPAITLTEQAKRETYKCFLKGSFQGKELLVMPSFNILTTGTNILNQQFLSPYLEGSLDNFEVFIVEDKVYYFGKVKNLK